MLSAFGFVDGYHFPVTRAEDLNVENAYYNGWCSSHFTSNVFLLAPEGTIIHATINALGSWHSSAVARAIYQKLIHKIPSGYYLIADTAFLHAAPALEGKIKTPPKTGCTQYPNDPIEAPQFKHFNEELVSARQAAEWGMRCLQGSFG